jgi:hypothetical protein
MKKQNTWAVYRLNKNQLDYPVRVAQTREAARFLKSQMMVPSMYRVAKIHISLLSVD